MWPPPNEPDKATPVPLRDKMWPPSKEADKATLGPLMDKLLDAFQHLHRLSGSAEAEQAVDQLIRQLEDAGLSPERKSCQLYLSDPIARRFAGPAGLSSVAGPCQNPLVFGQLSGGHQCPTHLR